MKDSKKKIISVSKGSSADLAGIVAGDLLVEVNGQTVRDVFDYRMGIADDLIELKIEHSDGSQEIYEIEKDEYEDPGLEFESYLMDREKVCKNKCIFCFVDQLPGDARKSLKFKDDDLRLSFLTGNFVTLTNVDDCELDRLISYKLSPLNISVHATEPNLRVQMLGNPKAAEIMRQLKKIADAGISLNTQIVLCPGINDGAALERTLDDLSEFAENMLSIAVVPVGLTKHRGGRELKHIRPFGRSTAAKVIELITNRQQMYLSMYGKRLVFAADELYIKAGMKIPAVKDYEDFYQIENGVGLMALFIDEMRKGISSRIRKRKRKTKNPKTVRSSRLDSKTQVLMVTGTDAAPYLEEFAGDLSELYNISFRVLSVFNRFFGETVTVAGLVTGSDILRELDASEHMGDCIVAVPDVMLRDSGDRFLDDMTVGEFVSKADREVIFVPSAGKGFLEALDERLI